MKKISYLCVLSIVLALFSGSVVAQDSGYHPNLSDNLIFAIGAFRTKNTYTLSAEGNEIGGEDIDFSQSVGVEKNSTIANVQLRWKFGSERKWSIWGQWFSNNAEGDATLDEDVEWEDIIFNEGTFVEGGVKLELIRAFVGRSFVLNDQHDFGAGIGIHNLDLSAFIGGEVGINNETTGYQSARASASGILPNIGVWYNFSPASRWLLHARADLLSANIGDYDGTMWNIQAGANFQAWRHVGIDLSYQYFDLNVGIEKDSWNGNVDLANSGPIISLTANW